MARRIRLPGLVDLTLVTAPAEIAALAAAPALDRRFLARGPLVNRLIAGRIRRWFQVNGQPLPALAERDDATREERQASLLAALEPGSHALWSETQLERLADHVRGRLPADAAGVTVQEIVGRCFSPGYVADAASWEAALMIDDFRDRLVAPRHLLWLITGRLRRARALLVERAGHDRHAMHATSIGVHGIVKALERMRALHATPDGERLGEDATMARCLHPPRRVPRTCEAMLTSPAVKRPLRPGSMVMLELERAAPAAPGAATTFLAGQWSFCPAMAFVPALLRAVWRRAQGPLP